MTKSSVIASFWIGLILSILSANAISMRWCYSQSDCASTPEAVCSTSAFGFTNSSGFYDPSEVCSRAYSGIVEFDEYGPNKALCNITTNANGDCGDSEEVVLNHSRTIYRDGTCSAGNRLNSIGQCEKECQPPYSFSPSENACVLYCPPSSPNLNASMGQCGLPDDTPPPDECTAGNPVLISTGEKVQKEEPDYQGHQLFPLRYQRNYQSRRAPEADPLYALTDRFHDQGGVPQFDLSGRIRFEQPENYQGGAGDTRGEWRETAPRAGYKQWHHNYEYALRLSDNGVELILERPAGRRLRFNQNGSEYVATDLSGDKVTPASGGGWVYQPEPELTEYYNSSGQLTRLEKFPTLYHTLSYNAQGLLESVTHSSGGGTIGFTYSNETPPMLSAVSLPNGSTLTYQYDTLGNLTHVVRAYLNADGSPETRTRQYHYEDARHAYALTGITDERNIRYANWTYDELGRVIESRHGEGDADKTTFDYQGENTTVVTNALNKQTIYHYSQESGVKRLQTVEGVATTLCAGANKAYTYDAHGFVATKTDWKGNITTYNSRDDQGRELSRTEATGTPEERTIETEWHPDFDLPTKITELERITHFTYDTSGRLLTKTITPRVAP